MSKRHDAAQRIADYISDARLTNPFGGNVYKTTRNKRPIYGVDFAIPRALDGRVEIWGLTFIRIVTRGPASRPATVCKSVDDAIEFLRDEFPHLGS